MLGPFATASLRTLHCHSPGVASRYCCTPPAHRCPQQRWRRQQRQRVTEGTARPHRMGPIRCHRNLNRKTLVYKTRLLTTRPRIQLQNNVNESAWPRGRQMAYSAWAPDGRPRPPSMNIHMGQSQPVKKILPVFRRLPEPNRSWLLVVYFSL